MGLLRSLYEGMDRDSKDIAEIQTLFRNAAHLLRDRNRLMVVNNLIKGLCRRKKL